jgi:hypothetical protein
MALLGRREMSDLSPQSGQKRTLITSLSPIAIFPALEDQLAEPGAVELEPGAARRRERSSTVRTPRRR